MGFRQGHGRSLWVMQGMFKANGGCGYVKKPDFLLKTGPHNEVFDPKHKSDVKTTLKVSALFPRLLTVVGFSPLFVIMLVYSFHFMS